ncbi:MAG: hypothetical protein HC905_25455 [Bacteroidales bacterium]|nr:hypothetical protein [Bacteroidales bacterium]
MTAGRLTWEYLKKLYVSFGKASVLTDIYKSELKNLTGINNLRITNPFTSLVYTNYLFIKHFPKIMFLKMTNKWKEGSRAVLMHEWRKGKLSAHKELYTALPEMVAHVRNSQWLKNK